MVSQDVCNSNITNENPAQIFETLQNSWKALYMLIHQLLTIKYSRTRESLILLNYFMIHMTLNRFIWNKKQKVGAYKH